MIRVNENVIVMGLNGGEILAGLTTVRTPGITRIAILVDDHVVRHTVVTDIDVMMILNIFLYLGVIHPR